jgi:multicomponent Na+:H+ antiporter subunit G
MELLINLISWFLFTVGSAFLLVGAIGIIRLPDIFSRMHGAGIIDTMGTAMLFFGMFLQAGFTIVSLKLFMILLFLMFTSPTTTHALARAALDAGLKPLVDNDEPDLEKLALLKKMKKERTQLSKT